MWLVPSPIAALVAFWYVQETGALIVRALGTHRRAVIVAYLAPRAVGSAISFLVAYYVFFPWQEVLALSYVCLLAIEFAYRLILERVAPDLLNAARDPSSAVVSFFNPAWLRRTQTWRSWLAASVVLLSAFVIALTIYAQSAYGVVTDVDFYLGQYTALSLYRQYERSVGQEILDLARAQGADARRAVGLMSDTDATWVARLVLPEAWTAVMVEKVLDATLSWLQDADPSAVPPVTVPVDDVQRHTQEAMSVLYDRYASQLPLCSSDRAKKGSCRPPDLSQTAYLALYKPRAMARSSDVFTLIPAELDLATAVTLFPGTFDEVLGTARVARDGLMAWQRWLGRGVLLSILLFCTSMMIGVWSLDRALGRGGAALALAGIETLWLGWLVWRVGLPLLRSSRVGGLFDGLSSDNGRILRAVLNAAARDTLSILFPWALALVVLGMLLLGASRVMARRGLALYRTQAWRAWVVLAALYVLGSGRYRIIVQRQYEQALADHRSGEAEAALVRYRRIERLFPFVDHELSMVIGRNRRECERYQVALSSYQRGEYERAIGQFEAVLVGDPVLALRDAATGAIEEALYTLADRHRADGSYERALDHYRTLSAISRDRRVQQAMADLYFDWGRAMAAHGDLIAAIATLGRSYYDLSSPRLWRMADQHAVRIYCDWVSGSSAGSEWDTADPCQTFLFAYPGALKDCPDCAR
jgi:tetratricopeptide (TPR) repeat protein